MHFDHDLDQIDNISGRLTIGGTGNLKLPSGTTAQRVGGSVGDIRINTDSPAALEAYLTSSWIQLANAETAGIAAFTGGGTGYIARTAAGTYQMRNLVQGTGISISNLTGTADPTIALATLADAGTGSFVKITRDTYGRVSGTTAVVASDITSLVSSTYVNVSGDTMTGNLDMGSYKITSTYTPVANADLTNKLYVDSAIQTAVQGLDPKASVRAATTAAGTLATSFANGQVIDGVTLVTGDRILIKNQSTASENGIYIVAASGAPSRAADANSWTELVNAFTFIEEGTTLADTGWVCSSNAGGTLGSTAVTFVKFSSLGSYTGSTNIDITGQVISITGTIPIANGGTNNGALGVTLGGIIYTDGTKLVQLAPTATAGQMLRSGASAAPTWSTATWPNTTAAGKLLYSSSANTVAELALGTANQVLGMNNGATAPEYKTITQGTGITVTHGVGTITIANSIAALQLYKENPSSPTAPTVSGTNSIAIGSGSTASAAEGFAIGNGSDARVWGMTANANGKFATAGDAQQGLYILRNITSNATPTELFLDGSTTRLTLPNNSVFCFKLTIVARRTDIVGSNAAYTVEGIIKRDASAATTAFVGTPTRVVLAETSGSSAMDITVTADTTNGSLKVMVTGIAAQTIRWVAKVDTVEVTN